MSMDQIKYLKEIFLFIQQDINEIIALSYFMQHFL